MSAISLITLLTDFGTRDEYVGVMKGVILSLAPAVSVVDISHEVPPQDVRRAAYPLEGYHRYFPRGTVHVVVVDPGVGGPRAIVAVKAQSGLYLVPDNGVLERIIDDLAPQAVVRVENRAFFRPDVSDTFHGRDIFAPVAAHLAAGADIHSLGPATACADLVRLDMARPAVTAAGEVKGCVITFDGFGNAVTNIRREHLHKLALPLEGGRIEVRLAGRCIAGLWPSYDAVPVSNPLAIIGSRGHLEVAVNCGNAKEALGLAVGERVVVRGVPPGSYPCENT